MTSKRPKKKISKIWNSLLFKIPVIFISLLLLTVSLLFIVLNTIGKDLLQEEMYEEVRLTGIGIINRLDEQITHAESLAISLAKLAENLPADTELHQQLLPNLIDYNDAKDFIAGGGIWPEPYLFEEDTQRRSFFWGRNQQGILEYYDDYNNPEGNGYHHEEWYIPAKYIKPKDVFWSKSYVDPYSHQPMVTVTAPIYKNKMFYGVSTIDLKLSGLKSLLKNSSKALKGYAFALDRNGKFLSFPDEKLIMKAQSSEEQDFIYLNELAQRIPDFKKIAEMIQNSPISFVTNESHKILAEKIAEESYQINADEAMTISHIINAEKSALVTSKPIQFILEKDYFLKQPILVSIITMPETYWKIVLVLPQNKLAQKMSYFHSGLGVALLIYFSFLTVFILLYLNHVLINPLRKISSKKHHENIFLSTDNASEIQQLVDLFNQRSQQLIEANQAKYDFLSNMSHEFRTPLNAIMGFSQLLEIDKKPQLTESQLHYVQRIYSSGEHLLTLVSDILEFSKMEDGKIEINIKKVCLNVAVECCLNTIQTAFKDSGIIIKNQLPKEKIFISADKQLIYQVLLNLLSNAMKYNRPDGSVTVEAQISNHGTVKVFIIDTGYGISEKDKKNLFQPFERLSAKNSAILGGGIGLSYCEQLMMLMNGSIGVESVVNEGSSFWIEIKVA